MAFRSSVLLGSVAGKSGGPTELGWLVVGHGLKPREL